MTQTRDELGKRRVEQLAQQLVRLLERDGYVVRDLDDLTADVETWRTAARRAGRILGWSVRTVVNEHAGRVWLVDNRPARSVRLSQQKGSDRR